MHFDTYLYIYLNIYTVEFHHRSTSLIRPPWGYLADKNPPPLQDPTVALCLGTCGDPRGWGVSYERGTSVTGAASAKTSSRLCVCVVCVCVCIRDSESERQSQRESESERERERERQTDRGECLEGIYKGKYTADFEGFQGSPKPEFANSRSPQICSPPLEGPLQGYPTHK